jgi:hypothetical protein
MGLAVFVMSSVGIARAETLDLSGHNTVTVCSGGQCGRDRDAFTGTLILDPLTESSCRAPCDDFADERCRVCGTYGIPRTGMPCDHAPAAPDAEVGTITKIRVSRKFRRVWLSPADRDAFEESLGRCVGGSLKLVSYSHRYTERLSPRSRGGTPVRRTGSLTLRLRIRTGGRTLSVRDHVTYRAVVR